MPEQCPQDGGFIGSCGCTHPNHEHSELVKAVLEDSHDPYPIEPEQCTAALEEGFYVSTRFNTRVGFGKDLLRHLEEHDPEKADERKALLLYAVDTARTGRRGPNPSGEPDSFSYAKKYEDGTKILLLTDKEGIVERAFTFYDKNASGSASGPSFHSGILKMASANRSSSARVQHGRPSGQKPNTGFEYNSSMTRLASSGVQTSGARTLHKVSSVIRPMP